MGCGASNNSPSPTHNGEDLNSNKVPFGEQGRCESTLLLTGIAEDQEEDNMFKKANNAQEKKGSKSKGDKGSGDSKGEKSKKLETIEKKLRSRLSIPEEDIQSALSLASKHPNLHEQFLHSINILHETIKSNRKQFVKQLVCLDEDSDDDSDVTKHVFDFFAMIGGAKVTVEIYSEQLKKMNVTYLTDEILDGGVDEKHETALFVIEMIHNAWENATDSSLEFGGRLVEANVLSFLVEDLKHLEESFDATNSVFDKSVTFIHNCARSWKARPLIRDAGVVQLLTPFLAREEKEIKLLTLLTLSYIIDEEENHLLFADASDFRFLLDSVSLAWASEGHRDPSGYSLEELLQGLGNLAHNDDNKKLLMEKGVLLHLKPILDTGKDEEKQEAAQIVWKLAFDRNIRNQMENDQELMEQLRKLKNSSHKGVAKRASGALWVMDMDKKVQKGREDTTLSSSSLYAAPLDGRAGAPSAPPAPPPPSSSSGAPPPPPPMLATPGAASSTKTGHIMISYQWGNQKTLLQISSSLRERGFRVWMDVDNISGSTLQAMAEAVEQADAVLMCMSQRYKDSDNCRTEAEYAFALHKPIIPLLMEKNYKPDGWLGILRGSKLFFDFSGKYSFEKKLDDLVKELGQKGQDEVDGPIAGKTVAPVASAPVVKVNSWTQKDVHNWLNKHQLSGCPKLQNLSGENVNFLKKLSNRAPEFFYTYLKQDLGLSTLNHLMYFSDAIDDLP